MTTEKTSLIDHWAFQNVHNYKQIENLSEPLFLCISHDNISILISLADLKNIYYEYKFLLEAFFKLLVVSKTQL